MLILGPCVPVKAFEMLLSETHPDVSVFHTYCVTCRPTEIDEFHISASVAFAQVQNAEGNRRTSVHQLLTRVFNAFDSSAFYLFLTVALRVNKHQP